MSIIDNMAKIKLQCLFNHTSRRLVHELNLADNVKKLKIYCKWGFDGSTWHSEYKQAYDCDESTNKYDKGIFLTSMVPIHIIE